MNNNLVRLSKRSRRLIKMLMNNEKDKQGCLLMWVLKGVRLILGGVLTTGEFLFLDSSLALSLHHFSLWC